VRKHTVTTTVAEDTEEVMAINYIHMEPTTQQNQNELQERLGTLPEEILSLITRGTLDATVFELRDLYNLTNDQVRLLENEIILVLSFFESREAFVQNVTESLEIEPFIAEDIGMTVTSQIFELVDDYFEVVEQGRKASLNGVVPGEVEAVVAKKSELASLAAAFGKKEPERLENPEVETFTSNVAPLRTMESDIKRVHGYGVAETETPEESLENKK
jgi:hypothetical protein